MHMADALISPAVGATLWVASAGIAAACARKLKQSHDDRLVPMMGVLGAFVFTAMMINFSIPGTGSSGHLGGGLLLAILLGPEAAFLVMASVLTIQALFFADGGLLALGCNLFNLGFFPAFIAYPFIYRPLMRCGGSRAWIAPLVAAVLGLQLGAFGVVLETKASGISALPFGAFVLLMQPIHLAIGIVEGLATAALVGFVAQARPEALAQVPAGSGRRGLVGLVIAAIVTGGIVSWFASARPDGLEWAVAKVTGQPELATAPDGTHQQLAHLQQISAILPGYSFKISTWNAPSVKESWPAGNAGPSFSGIAGGLLTFSVAGLIGFSLRRSRRVRA
jgi:cobalt/nickel transport system permease protein